MAHRFHIYFLVFLTIFFSCFTPLLHGSGLIDLRPHTLPYREFDQQQLHPFDATPPQEGWWFPFTGPFSGFWDISVGFHVWYYLFQIGDPDPTPSDSKFILRNLQWRSQVYLAPGLRLSAILRSSRQYDNITPLEPFFDELFIEQFGFFQSSPHQLSYSLKLGRTRYLRFPYPDIISMYDQVPDIQDLRRDGTIGKDYSGYQGLLFFSEYSFYKSLGLHLSWIYWIDSVREGVNPIEQYAFFRDTLGPFSFEIRGGWLPHRNQSPGDYLGQSSLGYSAHVGLTLWGFHGGVFYEHLEQESDRTGVFVEFTPNLINTFLGENKMDYTRSPQGIGFQPILYQTHFGLSSSLPDTSTIVGIIIADRTTTYWQNGQGRNLYEHIVAKAGDTDPLKYEVAVLPGPSYLRIESLVSTQLSLTSYDDFIEWEKKRQGPAQIANVIVYAFYERE